MNISLGDLVAPKNGGYLMTVENIDDLTAIECVWFFHGDLCRGFFNYLDLNKLCYC